jgi:hypothetical protein
LNKRLASLAAVFALAVTGLFAPTAAAAAVPIVQDQIVIYEHANMVNEITRVNIAPCTAKGVYWNLNLFDASRISSVQLWVPNPSGTRCNRMLVQSADGPSYTTCISKHKWGIPTFGPEYNDNTWMIWVGHDPRCPSWNA